MKNLKFILLLIATFGFTTLMMAQPPRPAHHPNKPMNKMKDMTPEQRAEKITAKMAEELSLSTEQKEKIYKINLEAAVKNDEIKKEMDVLHEKMKAVNEQRKTSTEAVLTDAQKKILEEKKAEKQEMIQEKKEEMRERWKEQNREK